METKLINDHFQNYKSYQIPKAHENYEVQIRKFIGGECKENYFKDLEHLQGLINEFLKKK